MPFRWREIFQKENEIAKAHTDRAIDEHADPHDLVALTIRQLQDDHDKLEVASAKVVGEYNTAKEKLERDVEQEHALDQQGRAAKQAGHDDAAAAIAQQLIAVRQILAIEKPAFDRLAAQAAKIKSDFSDNCDMLKAKMLEAKTLDTEIDVAAAEHNANEATKAVTSMNNHVTPSFDSVRDRVHAARAQEEAISELEAANPDISEVHQAHLVNVAAADDVMAGWEKPADAARSGSSGSPSDRLNS